MLPMWSAAVDPRVLAVRALNSADATGGRLFDAGSADMRMVTEPRVEHLLIDRGGEVIRLDVIEGTSAAGPVMLRFDLADDDRLDMQLHAIQALREPSPFARSHMQLARRLLALHAIDARDTGASLREAADMVLGRGDWPGDGEHRKSLIRRLVVTGEHLIRAGAGSILSVF